ncbi:thioredoxin family protein [Nocardia halotolerans]|uniref:Thioredoxin family protein n=1 Tax=Nocardia halotolerans TaxID=1755878 RepID=A0ABV8VM88_9NOCA
MIEAVVVVLVVVAAVAVALYLRRSRGGVRPVTLDPETAERARLLAAAGVPGAGPTVLHFSAAGCGPCDAVRRVVTGVTAELSESPNAPRDIEIDIDAEPALARELNVLSLPTTFVFDAAGKERFRFSGVPKAGDLRTALESLTV